LAEVQCVHEDSDQELIEHPKNVGCQYPAIAGFCVLGQGNPGAVSLLQYDYDEKESRFQSTSNKKFDKSS
jgi:hypothetical protein